MPGLDFKSSLKILENDASVTEMALYAADERIVDVYVKHLTFEELEELVNPRRQSSVVIEEIVDSSQQVDENVVHLNSKSVGSRLCIGYIDSSQHVSSVANDEVEMDGGMEGGDDLIDPDYNILEGDEDLIDVLRSTGQLNGDGSNKQNVDETEQPAGDREPDTAAGVADTTTKVET